MFIRPAEMADHKAVLELAQKAGFGMTSLPPDPQVLNEKIAYSIRSFKGEVERGHEAFFFVLVDEERDDAIVGTCGIVAHVGLHQPFYSYKLSTITQVSRGLDIYSKHGLLQVCNDLTGATEIGALFLLPEYRRDRIGKLLSFSRFMFIATHPALCDEQVIAEMRGVHDAEGNAPFYNSIAKHFFKMPFAKADYINATQGNQFINDLMPKYPIYVSLLPKAAQRVIAQPNPASEPARAMLEQQGFAYKGYIDVFDGGPTLQANRDEIRSVKESVLARVSAITEYQTGKKMLIANERFAEFRCTAGAIVRHADGTLSLDKQTANALQISVGDTIRIVE